MKILRRISRIILLMIWFSSLIVIVAACNFWRRKWSAVRSGARWTAIWAKGTARIINMRIRVHGDPAQCAGKLVVSNHTGGLDIIAEGSILPLRFAPKAEMRRWPLFGLLVSLSHPVWIDRGKRTQSAETAEEIAQTLAHGYSILVYPEGTSTDGRHGMLPFKSTAFEAALQSRSPLQPVLIFHQEQPVGLCDTAWHGDTGFSQHIWSVLGLKEIHTSVYIMPEITPLPGEDRKSLAARTHRLMSEMYEKYLPECCVPGVAGVAG